MQESRDCVHNTARDIEASGRSIDEVFSGIGKTVTAAFSITTAAAFVKKIYEVRSYFQDIESSMVVFLGNQEKAAKFTKDLKDYAWYNMFEFSDLADASKQLIAYGNDVDKISGKGGILDQLSNIATATKQPLMDLVNLWNKAKGTGKVDANAMESWANKGLVLRDVLQEIGETVNGNTVSFEQLQMAIQHVTDEGGMFAGIMDQMMPNLSSSWGQLQDDLDSMFNEIGESMQGAFKGGIEFASTLVANYKDVIDVISTLVGIYGTYRVALFTLNTLEKAHAAYIALEETAHIQNALATEADIAVKGKATVATVLFQKAQAALNATLLSNPYVLVAAAIAALVGSMIYLATNVKSTQEVIDDLNDSVSDMKDMKEETSEVASLADEYDNLKSKAELSADESARLLQITQQLAGYLPTAISNFDEYGNAIDINTEAVREEIEQRNQDLKAIMQGRLNEAMSRRQEVEEKMQRNRDILSTGMVTWRANGQDVSAEATAWEKQKAMERLEQLRSEYSTLNSTIREANKVVTGYYDNLNAFTGALSDKNIEQLQQIKTALEEQIKSGEKGVLTVGDFFTYDFSGKSDEFISEALSEISKKLPQKGTETQDRTADKIADEKNKLKELIRDAGRAMQDAQDDMQSKITDATIAAMDEGEAKVKAARAKANQDELDDIETQRKNAIRKYIESQKKIFDQKEKIKKTQDVKYKVQYFDESTVDLTEINKMYDELANLTAQRQVKDEKKQMEDDMRSYLREYGSFLEKRLALTKEYEEKILNARTEGEKKSLEAQLKTLLAQASYDQARLDYMSEFGSSYQKKNAIRERYNSEINAEDDEWKRRSLASQRDKELYSVDLEAIRKDIDWAKSLDEFGSAFKDITNEIYNKAFSYSRTDEFRNLSAEEQQSFLEMLEEMKSNIKYSLSDLNFVEIGKSIDRFREKTEKARKAVENRETAENEHYSLLRVLGVQSSDELKTRVEDLKQERDQLAAKNELTDEEQKRLANLNNRIMASDATMKLLTVSEKKLQQATDDAANAQNEANNEGNSLDSLLDRATGAIDNFASGLSSIMSADSFSELWSGLTTVFQNLGGKFQGIIGAIISVVDVVAGDRIREAFNEGLTNFEKLNDATDRYISALETSIELLKDQAKEQTGADKVESYRELLNKVQDERIAAIRRGAARLDVDRNDGLFGGYFKTAFNGKDTITRDAMDNLGWQGFADISTFLGRKVRNSYDDLTARIELERLYELPIDKLKEFMRDYSELFGKLPSEVQEDLKTIYGYLQQEQNYIAELKEELLHMTFDDMYSSFVDRMKDIDSTAKDTASDIRKYFFDAMIDESFQNKYKEQMKALYNDMADIMGQNVSDEDFAKAIEGYSQRYQEIVDNAMIERERLQQISGYFGNGDSYKQEATSKGYQAMSQELGASLEGRFTTLVITGENIAAQMIVVTGQISDMRVICESSNGYLEEIRNMFILANGYLEDIYKYSKQIYNDFSEKLDEIATNTK